MKRIPLATILLLWSSTRLLLIVGAFFSFILFPVAAHTYPHTPVNISALLFSWEQWDAVRYVHLAQYGYRDINDSAFFPLYPLIVKLISLPLGIHAVMPVSLLVSNLALLGALIVLYLLAADAMGEAVAKRTIVYLCLFPTAFFFFTSYNESLFLLLSCSSLFAMRRQRWFIAGLVGLLAALTRSAGVLLVVPYLCELWLSSHRAEIDWQKRLLILLAHAWPGGLIPLGTLLYCLFCWRHFHHALAFALVQRGWGRSLTFPWTGLISAIRDILFGRPFASFLTAHLLLDLTATLAFLALAILGWNKLRLSYTLWIGVLLIYMLSSSAMSVPDMLVSNQRFVLEMFPGFLTLAMLGLKHPRLHQALLLTMPFLQALFAALFVLNRWMV